VVLTVLGTFYAARPTEFAFRWLTFACVSALVFGYQLHDFWIYKRKLRFWLPMMLLFVAHFLFWTRYVRPHFDGDPHWVAGGAITFVEYVVVTLSMKFILPTKGRNRAKS